jgi:hypothetical protein
MDKQSYLRGWSVICDLRNTDHRAQSTSSPLGVIIRQHSRWQLGSGIVGAMIGVMLVCVQLYNNLYSFSPIPSCVAIPNRPGNRPLSEHQESGQSDRGALKCARQSNPGLLGHARAPVRLTQNRKLGGTGRYGPHRVSQPIGGSPRNPPVRDRTIGDKWGEAVQRGCTGE